MKKNLLAGLIIAGIVLAGSVTAQACVGKSSSCIKCQAKAKECKVTKLKTKAKVLWMQQDALGITDEQLDQVKEVKHKAIKELIQLKADLDVLMVDFKSAMWNDMLDEREINKLIDAKYDVKKESAKVFIAAIADIQEILTEDQRAAWKGFMVQCQLGGAACDKVAGAKICPLTGKPLSGSGGPKGSMK